MEYFDKNLRSSIQLRLNRISYALKGIFARQNILVRELFRFFFLIKGINYRLPGRTVLFLILVFDLTVMGFASYNIFFKIDKKAQVVSDMCPISYQSQVIKTVPPEKARTLLLDNFNNASKNSLGGNISRLNSYGGICSFEIENDEAGRYLQIVYDVASPSSYSGYITSINGFDLTGYKRLNFQIKGEYGGEAFKVEIGDSDSISSISISHVLPYGISNDWQTVSIPLKNFASIKNWENMAGSLSVLFEHTQGMPYKGKIYVRNINFRR